MCEKLPCVCDICNCGRHRCPHKLRCPGKWDKCTVSEYSRHFVPHDACLTKSFKPFYRPFLGEGPLSNETTNRVDYIERCVEPPKTFKPAAYVKPEGAIDDVTMYRKEFGPKESCPPIVIRPPPARRVPAKFDGVTTNRSDFRKFDLPPKHVLKSSEYFPNPNKFEGIGSYERDFIPHSIAPTKSFKPVVSFLQSEEPMSQETDYRQSYIKLPIEPKIEKIKPTHLKSRAPFDSMTTHKKEYTPKEICLQKSFKPPPHFIQADKPLSNETTNRADFIAHDTERPFQIIPEKYVKPDAYMDLNTTYNKDFIDLPACKIYSVKPPESRRISAPFDGNTSYRETFQKWDVPAARAIKRDVYEPSTDPFQDSTTSKCAFVPHELCAVKSFKPPPHMLSNEPFDDATMYNTEYTIKSQPCCPAAFLNTNTRSVSPDGYIYHCEDQRGHLHYRRGSIPSTEPQNADKNASNSHELLHEDPPPAAVLPPLAA